MLALTRGRVTTVVMAHKISTFAFEVPTPS